ncbi:MAG: OmpA family protein [Prevotellaceae bacterium]|jgi:outer membrane protein OmpA-like peptidoglycan-associated protein|nr:OmpA family protein [Prevotellaceae bacterium]
MNNKFSCFMIGLLFCVASVQGQNYSSEVTANFGGGFSYLKFNLNQNGWKNSMYYGYNAGLGYTYFFPKSHFGLAVGAEAAKYNNNVLFPKNRRIVYNVPTADGLFHVIENNDGTQKFGTWFVNIPLAVRYLVPVGKHSVYFSLGGQAGIPFSPLVDISGAGNAEIGARFALAKRLSLYVGAYGEYGFNNIKKSQPVAAENLNAKNILLASNATGKINTVSFGLKIRIGLGFGKKYFSEEETAETKKNNSKKKEIADNNKHLNEEPKKDDDKQQNTVVNEEINDNDMPYSNPEKVDKMSYSHSKSNIPDNKYHNGDFTKPIANPYDVNGNEIPDYREWGDNDDMNGNGIPNRKDPDIDGDGIPNENDKTPYGASSYRGFGENSVRPDESDLPADPNNPLGIVKFDTPIIQFGEPSDVVITPYARNQMDLLVKYLVQHPKYYIVVVGHTCDLGTKAQNLHVGLTRANNVAAYLVSRGISQNKIITISKNDLEPRAPNTSEQNRRKNRRVEFKIRSVKP